MTDIEDYMDVAIEIIQYNAGHTNREAVIQIAIEKSIPLVEFPDGRILTKEQGEHQPNAQVIPETNKES